jgi:hypothetical protein
MLLENSDKVMGSLRDSDVVLDIGGWAHPFNRANYVMDSEPYDSRGFYNRARHASAPPFPPLGGEHEYFTEQSWIKRDICDRGPFPFADKSVDMVICSHTLEDIRDPLWVCSEMIRIGRAGYIEVPSRIWETTRGHEPGIAGLSHHRWLIDIDQEAQSITFTPKFHCIHTWRNSLPASILRGLTQRESVQWLFWNESFTYNEPIIHGLDKQMAELASFVDRVHPYSPIEIGAWRAFNVARGLVDRVHGRLLRAVQ